MKKDLLTEAYEQISLTSFVNKLISEGKTEKEIEVILKEAGMWDRFKATSASVGQKLAGAGQSVKGVANQAIGAAKTGIGNAAAKAANYTGAGQFGQMGKDLTGAISKVQQSGQAQTQKGQTQVSDVQGAAQAAKVNSIFQSHTQDINNLVSAINNDLSKLGITTSKISSGFLIGKLREMINKGNPDVQINKGESTASYMAKPQQPAA